MKNIEDIYKYMHFIFKCQRCFQFFPIWWVSREEWKRSGFKRKTVCKMCFERVVPSPHYYTIDEYMAERVYGVEEKDKEKTRALLAEIWNMPTEYDILGFDDGLTEEAKRLYWATSGL